MLAYYLSSTHTLTVTLTDTEDAGVTGATVVCTVVDRDGEEVSGQSWPLSLTDAGSGSYTGTVEHDLDVTKGQRLTAQVTATKSSVQRYAEVPVIVRVDDD